MKCIQALESKEQAEMNQISSSSPPTSEMDPLEGQYEIIILGGLSGRLDQTIHTLSYLHKLRKKRKSVYAVTDDNIGWVLDSVRPSPYTSKILISNFFQKTQGEHTIPIDHTLLGPTCGLLPVGIDETMLSTKGLKWNLTNCPSGFDALVSTSNHLAPGEDVVWIKTTKPIWWTVELRSPL
jgi:thiamine pyrophosphokinase